MSTPLAHPISPLRSRLLWPLLLLLLVGLTWVVLILRPWSAAPPPPVPPQAVSDTGFSRLPILFIPNRGQTDPVVRFQVQNPHSTIFFTSEEILFALPSTDQSVSVRLTFADADPTPEIEGVEGRLATVNYLIGDDPARWQTNLPTYGSVIYHDLYPGIDLRYDGTATPTDTGFLLKGTYTIAPGADPGRIRWQYAGPTDLRLDEAGNLIIALPPSTLVEQAPTAWQWIDRRRAAVEVRYRLAADGSLAFDLPDGYNPAYPLIIDPALIYSTYLGGNRLDFGNDIALDAAGNIYVAGRTHSTDFPTADAIQPDFGGSETGGDAFVAKFDPTGANLIYATYLGGSGGDSGWALAVAADERVTLVGDTTSANFPVVNAAQPISGGGGPFEGDAFIAQLAADGSALIYSTYLGGKGDELAYSVSLDGQGNPYLAGYTSSVNFPIRNAPQPNPAFPDGLNIQGDGFVTSVISASGVYTWGLSTFLGGTTTDAVNDIALAEDGTIYLTGNTRSADFPTYQAIQPNFGGGFQGDGFVTTIISASSVYTWGFSTYLGGADNDAGNALALDSLGDPIIVGETASADFPSQNPYQITFGGERDAFITRIISAGGVYTWGFSTYLGGSGPDIGFDIALDAADRLYLTGYAGSPNFPVTANAFKPTCAECPGSGDVFFTRLNATATTLDYSTYLGGVATDFGQALTAAADGSQAYLTGFTYSTDFPTSANAFDDSCGADGLCNGFLTDAFVARFSMAEFGQAVYLPLVVRAIDQPPATCAPYAVATIPVGQAPRGIALDSTRQRAYVANYGSNSISVINTANHTLLTTINDIISPTGVAYDSNQNIIWVTSSNVNQVYPIQANDSATAFTPLGAIIVGLEPWGIVYNPFYRYLFVANHGDDSVTVIDAQTRTVIDTLTGYFDEPYQIAANPVTGKVFVPNYGNATVTTIKGNDDIQVINLFDSTQPYDAAVDEVRGLIYISTVDSHRLVVISSPGIGSDTVLGWVELKRGGDPNRPVPLRAVAVNPLIGPTGDGGHLWATTTMADGSELGQALLFPKGWNGGFHSPIPADLDAQPGGGIAIDRLADYVYLTGGSLSGRVTVLGDLPDFCSASFRGGDQVELSVGER